MSARADVASRIERALDAHEIAASKPDERTGDVLVRCACQPRDGPLMTKHEWRQHVAERATAAALRIY